VRRSSGRVRTQHGGPALHARALPSACPVHTLPSRACRRFVYRLLWRQRRPVDCVQAANAIDRRMIYCAAARKYSRYNSPGARVPATTVLVEYFHERCSSIVRYRMQHSAFAIKITSDYAFFGKTVSRPDEML